MSLKIIKKLFLHIFLKDIDKLESKQRVNCTGIVLNIEKKEFFTLFKS